jgi:predicted dehydrogenase
VARTSTAGRGKTASKTASKSTRISRKQAPETIGVGIIGSGGIARGVHIPGYQKLPNVKVIAVSDPFEGARTGAAEQFGIESAYEDFNEMLQRDDIHAVSVTTPNFLHAEATIAALEAGKHVLCEKPLAMNAQEGEAMVEAARRTGNKLMCGFISLLARSAVPEALCRQRCVRRHVLRAHAGPAPPWHSRLGHVHQQRENGGGPLIDIGVHMLDSTLHVLGFPKPIAVSGQTYQKFGKRKDVLGLMGQWDYKNFTVEDFAVA